MKTMLIKAYLWVAAFFKARTPECYGHYSYHTVDQTSRGCWDCDWEGTCHPPPRGPIFTPTRRP